MARVTRDHVPPKSLFSAPRPPDLITVPACVSCHSGTDVDDEYFRGVVALRHDATNTDAAAARRSFFRSLSMPQKAGLKRAFLGALTDLQIRTAAGLYLGKRHGYNVDLPRLDRVMARTIRGLYYKKVGTRLPPDAEVRSWNEDGLVDLDSSGLDTLRSILAPLGRAAEHRIGDGTTFRFRYSEASDREWASAWLLTVYDHTNFLGITVPAGESVGTVDSRAADFS